MSQFSVQVRPQEFEGVSAEEWEIHPTGALIFHNRPAQYFVEFVIAYAPGSWLSFFEDNA